VGKRFRGLEVSEPDWCQIPGTVPAHGDYFVLVAGYPARPRSQILWEGPATRWALSVLETRPGGHAERPKRKAPLVAGLELRRRGLAYPASLRSISSSLMRVQIGGHAFGYTVLVSFSSADCAREEGAYVAGPHDEPRSGSNNSERESASGRSTNYESGHLIRVFRDIGRIFSLLFLLNHPSPIGHPLRGRVQKRKRNMVSSKAKNGFNCVSCGTHGGGQAGGMSIRQHENPAV